MHAHTNSSKKCENFAREDNRLIAYVAQKCETRTFGLSAAAVANEGVEVAMSCLAKWVAM